MILIPKHAMLRPDGTSHVINCDGPDVIRDTVMCRHCNKHGIYSPGCGKTLSKCPLCMGTICPDCQRRAETEGCIPIEKRLDLYEVGKIPSL